METYKHIEIINQFIDNNVNSEIFFSIKCLILIDQTYFLRGFLFLQNTYGHSSSYFGNFSIMTVKDRLWRTSPVEQKLLLDV